MTPEPGLSGAFLPPNSSLATAREGAQTIFSSPQFLEFQKTFANRTAFYVIAKSKGEPVMSAPVVLFRNRLGYTAEVNPPIIHVDWNRDELLRFLLTFLQRRFRPLWVDVNQRACDPKVFPLQSKECQIREEVVIDLTRDVGEVYHSMAKRARYSLRKITGCDDEEIIRGDWLDKSPLTISQYEGPKSESDFLNLYSETSEKIASQWNPMVRPLNPTYWTKERMAAFLKALPPHRLSEIFTIYDESGKPQASAILLKNDLCEAPSSSRFAYYFWGASSASSKRRDLPVLLHWHVIVSLKDDRYARYSLGNYESANPDYGPYLFKKNFGGDIVDGQVAQYRRTPFKQGLALLDFMRAHQTSLPRPLRLQW